MDADEDFMTADEDFMTDADSIEPDVGEQVASDLEDLSIAMCENDQGPGKRDFEEFHYEILTPDEIDKYMCEIIREVTNVVQIPHTTARILLNHFKWDREKLIEMYYDCNDLEKLFKDAQIVSPFRPSTTAVAKNTVSGSVRQSCKTPQITLMPIEDICDICYTELPINQITSLDCAHRFCSPCWAQYLTMKIMDEGMGQTISCPAHKCDILVDDVTVMRLVNDKKVRVRYQHSITNNFVECNRLIRWCPSTDCTNAIKVQNVDSQPVTCKCLFTFCYMCGHEWHDPVNCQIFEKWLKKYSETSIWLKNHNYSETSNWIEANMKECPNCHVLIIKDGGCNHMTCKSQICNYEFCWVCMGPWKPHGPTWYSCNCSEDSNARASQSVQERAPVALQRYLHYSNRYTNHKQSLKFENKLYATVKAKMEKMQEHGLSWIEVQFLHEAVDVLCLCRRTLMFTYVFAYYLNRNNQTIILEDNQQDLEISTDQLSEFLEKDLENENLTTLKQKVQDKYRYCDQRHKVLLDHCHEGNDKDWWTFIE